MKRRNFNKSCVALLAMPLGLFKQQLPYVVTFEDGWRVLRARTGDTIYMDTPIVAREGENLRIASNLHSTAEYGIVCERNASVEVLGSIERPPSAFAVETMDEKTWIDKLVEGDLEERWMPWKFNITE